MHTQVLVLYSLFSIVWSHDITIGTNTEGRRIFDEIRQANPAIWRQYENVTVIAPENELIGRVVITDMRPEKDGDVEIIDGGDGKKYVTIELKSPTVLRGYEFHIEVYSVPETVFTDAEEEELPHDEIKISPSAETTELPNKSDSLDVPAVIAEDINTSNFRQGRESQEGNNPQTDLPQDITTTNSYEISSEFDTARSTESPENSKNDNPDNLNDNSFRPARETPLHTSVVASDPAVVDENINTTDNEQNNEATTQADVTTTVGEQPTPVPISFDNTKNTPDYPSLSILDYIKNKEGLRPMRHAQDDKNSESFDKVVQTEENVDTTPLAEETSTLKPTYDDTADLLPPEVDASYNNQFTTSLETTQNPVESSTYTKIPRVGRGIDAESGIPNEEYVTSTPTSTSEVTTSTLESEDVSTTTATFDDEQLRNTRDARKDPEDNANDVNTSGTPQSTCVPTEEGAPCLLNEKASNVIVLNLEQFMTRDGNNKVLYTLPIVLVIDSENNFPIIKIIADNTSTERDSKVYPIQPSNESLEPNEYDYKNMESEKTDDFMPSGDYDHN